MTASEIQDFDTIYQFQIVFKYSLTTLGETLLQPMKELRQWGREHFAQVVEARVQYDSASTEGSREADNISG
ncbi:hypothetical protein GCM10008014_16390 [Paenibacillus silvae]|uniref:HTH hxlR-type domain-containing protein n=1 Tax=Paenibacillus silvae TaxID=1325358 RepID=A0ABQ1Z821_9BACL|nr:hypothetical protein GCM10008014_16390 [Paenibacillus silvae]